MHTLQKQFILITMSSLAAVFLIIFVGINSVNYYRINQRLNGALEAIAENGGEFPKVTPKDSRVDFSKESPYETRYFAIREGQTAEEQSFLLDHIASVSKDEASAYLLQVLEGGKTFGYIDDYKYYVADTSHENYMVVFLYCRNELRSWKSILIISAMVAIISYLTVFLLVFLASKRVIRPFLVNIEKQKQFITDASHELKTPLGIIAANTDVMTLEHGQSTWTVSTQHQIERLTGLINGMVCLSRLDEQQTVGSSERFCISDAVLDMIAEFQGPAALRDLEIRSSVMLEQNALGDEGAFRQVLSILLDNAVKYAPEQSEISVELRSGKKRFLIQVKNLCDQLDPTELDRFFDRFYRADASRSKKPGYGIGLSIAKKTAELHKWQLSVSGAAEHHICFSLQVPGKAL